MYTYLLLNIGTIFFPFVLSFDRKVGFYKHWYSLFPAILITGAIFILWDIWFTDIGIWEFNPDYLTGIYVLNLPLEEWLFFLTVPYACVFIYECLIAYLPKDYLAKLSTWISWALIGLLIGVGIWSMPRYYTSITFLSLAAVLLYLKAWVNPQFMGWFYMGYFISLLPFILVNGILTALPVVIYNNAENLSLRIGTIPVEDTMYMMLLLLLNVSIFEYFRGRNTNNKGETVAEIPQSIR